MKRFRSLGLVAVPFFVAVLYCNGEVRDSREEVSLRASSHMPAGGEEESTDC